jgi:DNA-binding NarL/FixJ family response regulator
MQPIRILLVDDHALVRSAVRQALDADDMEVVGEAATAEEALLLAPQLHPDLILLDVDLPGTDGIRLVRELTPRLPKTRIVMLTVSTARRDLLEAIQSGAAGYLTKDLSPDALQRAIRGMRRGDLPMSRQMAATVVQHLTSSRGAAAANGNAGWDLSSREEQVLRLLAEGLTDREIGDRLVISSRTVETHVGNLLRKLGVRNRAQAAQRYRARMEREESAELP